MTTVSGRPLSILIQALAGLEHEGLGARENRGDVVYHEVPAASSSAYGRSV